MKLKSQAGSHISPEKEKPRLQKKTCWSGADGLCAQVEECVQSTWGPDPVPSYLPRLYSGLSSWANAPTSMMTPTGSNFLFWMFKVFHVTQTSISVHIG
jgi:hypothetical protein